MIKVGSKVKVLDSEKNRYNPAYAPFIGRVLTVSQSEKGKENLLFFLEEVEAMFSWRVKEIKLQMENK